ncbi:MAG: type II secretion system protein [Candidatus Paceibacterota bacterium]
MKTFFKKNNNKFIKSTSGFTLIELLVTIVIFVVLTGVVLFKQTSFDSTILLSNFAYDTAITIRQAQSYGLNTRESTVSGNFSPYGVYFNLEKSNKSFVFFADTGGVINEDGTRSSNSEADKIFNGNFETCPVGDLECVQKYTMKRGNFIKSICVGNNKEECDSNDSMEVTILFKYPEPDALIYAEGNDRPDVGYNYAEILLSSSDGVTRKVVITGVGQIYVEK